MAKKKPNTGEPEDPDFEESLRRMVKVGTAILNPPPGKPVLHKKKPPEQPKTEPAKKIGVKKRRKVK
ncbi:MAG: hypothetical protein JST22_09900 [Bacteroidetes bacterium]|nr:hypothetical protein [Bacteroidota bacterium]